MVSHIGSKEAEDFLAAQGLKLDQNQNGLNELLQSAVDYNPNPEPDVTQVLLDMGADPTHKPIGAHGSLMLCTAFGKHFQKLRVLLQAAAKKDAVWSSARGQLQRRDVLDDPVVTYILEQVQKEGLKYGHMLVESDEERVVDGMDA